VSCELGREQRDWAGLIVKAGRHLLDLLNDVLDIARIEGGHLSMSVEPVPVGVLVADVLDLVRPLADAASVQLAPAPQLPDRLCVSADRQRLRQVLINLLSNAIKYNHPTGTVTVSVELRPDQPLRIMVVDTGRGIAPELLGRLFTPFERLDAARAGFDGTGLGLALSRHLVQSMGGVLDVSSTPGRGSSFWVDLPVADPAAVVETAAEDAGLLALRGYPTSKRVLYVEDMVENVRLVESILARRPSIALIPAMLAGIALDLACEHRPDHIDQLSTAGVAAYLTKPIAVRDLLQTLDGLLDRVPQGQDCGERV
jgi:anti-sigma regulatory factor (Ser/Thr protein kinase)/CheY-like chemotaxis protein